MEKKKKIIEQDFSTKKIPKSMLVAAKTNLKEKGFTKK